MNYWLMKSEPETFGIDALAARPRRTTYWDGVRNFQARNFMRDQMRIGDLAFFYHSNCEEPSIVGIVKIVKEGYPDDSAFDRKQRKLKAPITLATLREHSNGALRGMLLLKRGNRLSITPVSAAHWRFILDLE